ncbi:MAG: hypothetical protein KGS48_07990 [Bacteroidetes bacterium]|nr:hypothetical protein [Bacteroidota bacterium]
MKKTVLSILFGAAMVLFMASCGEKLLTPEQVQAEINKGFEAGKAAVESEMNAKCDAEFEALVTEKLGMIKQAAAAGSVIEPPTDVKLK